MTNKIVFRSVEEMMTGYVPKYAALMPTFLVNSQVHDAVVGEKTYTQVSAKGDIRSKRITPKDTEIHQIGAGTTKKNYKKFFFGSQFIQSNLQDRGGYEDVVAESLDEHMKHNDELYLSGGGQNNGLLLSSDENFVLKGSTAIPKATDGTHFDGLYDQMVADALEANKISGKKFLAYFGNTMTSKFNGLFPEIKKAFSAVLGEADALKDYEFVHIETDILPAGITDGYAIINESQVKTHYMILPEVNNQGQNEEKNYAWTNFLQGSTMVEVKTKGGIIRRPLTWAA